MKKQPMKKKFLLNALMAGFIAVILYFFVGHDFALFYTGGKADFLSTAAQINERCNADGSCPTALDGWVAQSFRADMLSKGNLLYFVSASKKATIGDRGKENQEFRLIYQFFMPDNWFEARGGVGRPLTSDWESREGG